MNSPSEIIRITNILKRSTESQNNIIKKCSVCGSNYTLDKCTKCGNAPMV